MTTSHAQFKVADRAVLRACERIERAVADLFATTDRLDAVLPFYVVERLIIELMERNPGALDHINFGGSGDATMQLTNALMDWRETGQSDEEGRAAMSDKTRDDLRAFIGDALARGLTFEQMLDALVADKALGDVAVRIGLEGCVRDVIADSPYPDDLPEIMDDAGLREFLKRREQKKP